MRVCYLASQGYKHAPATRPKHGGIAFAVQPPAALMLKSQSSNVWPKWDVTFAEGGQKALSLTDLISVVNKDVPRSGPTSIASRSEGKSCHRELDRLAGLRSSVLHWPATRPCYNIRVYYLASQGYKHAPATRPKHGGIAFAVQPPAALMLKSQSSNMWLKRDMTFAEGSQKRN
jgi:hypothetical protein